MSETTDLNNAREQREQSENNNVETREYSETSQTDDAKKQSSNSESVGNSVQEKASLETPHKEIDSNPCSATLVVKTVKTSVSEPAAKISSAPLHNRSPNPVVLGTRVGSSIVPKQGASSLPVVPRTGVVSVNSVAINQPRVTTLTLAKGPVMTTPRTSTPSQSRPLVCSPQTLQLPANFQVPQGMVLIRSDSGQLMLVSQQALAQAQGMLPKLASTRASTVVRPPSSQGAVSGTQTIRVSLPSSSSSSASLKPNSTTATVLQKPSAPAVFTPAGLTGSTIIKSAGVIGSAARKPNIPVATVIKTSAITPNSGKTGTLNLKTTSASAATVINSSVVKSVSKGALPSQSNAPRLVSPNIPSRPSTSTSSGPVKVTAETLENVKKCKNFLVTLMKLASSGTRSADMAQNVRALVKSLLDGKLEAEEFTEKLYMELNSSPQPYLVPFLKRSLPAVRQLTPNSQLFIQQCNQLKPTDSATSTKAPVHKPTPPSGSTLKLSQPIRVTPLVNSTADGAQANSLTTARIPQALAEQGVSAKHPVALPPQNRSQPRHFVIQTSTQSTGAIVRQPILQASKTHFSQPLLPAQAHGFKDSTTGSFRDDDDINDVASMAGVNVSEENARILASGSELVGSVIRSCQEDPFLLPSALQRRALHIGGPHSITGVSPDALQLISLATQQRMKVLLEKLTALAQHREISYKEDWRYCQTSDTRSQLKFLEQLERLEKLRKEEEEREALIRIARSRSNSEDPEQQRLKQRAKEMQQLELAQMEHRDANLAALAALGPRKKKSLEAPGPRANQSSGRGQIPSHHAPVRITFRDLLFCMEQDPALRNSLLLYGAFLH